MNKFESKYFNTAVKMDLALISLLKKKPFEYITISELCNEAGVNRSTFYLHYENIGDLLNETAKYLIDDFISYFSNDRIEFNFNFSNCEIIELNFICDKYLVPYLTYIKDNKEVFLTVMSNGKSFGFDKTYKNLFENIFNPILKRFNYPEEDRNYVMMYYLNGINAINVEWMKNNCQKPISDILRIIKECVFGLNDIILDKYP
jgi:AcrR family transcriptional regulator